MAIRRLFCSTATSRGYTANGLADTFVQRVVHLRTDRGARDNQEVLVRYLPGEQEVETPRGTHLPSHRRGRDRGFSGERAAMTAIYPNLGTACTTTRAPRW